MDINIDPLTAMMVMVIWGAVTMIREYLRK
jgi:hypothetical protein